MKRDKDDTITWFQINNWVPLIMSAVAITGSFLMLKNDVSLLRQEVKHIAQQQSTMIELFKDVEQRYGEVALKVERLETLQGIEH